MDLQLTPDQELISSTARELLGSRCPMQAVRALRDEPDGYSSELWKEMVELGWMGLALPESYGGVGSGFLELCLVIEEMGRFCVPGPFLSTVACGALPVLRFGTEDQKATRLPAVAGEGRILSYVRAAPGGGWAPDGSDVTATPDGDGWVLDGEAQFVPYAHVAHELLVVAQTNGGDPSDLTALLVEAGSDRIGSEPLDTVGAEHLRRVSFRSVRVPETAVLGQAGGGGAVAEVAEAYGTAATCARLVGGAQRVLEMTLEYARDRQQFDRPIGSFQAVQHHCSNMAIDVLASRFIAYEAIWRLSAGREAATEVAMAKAWVSEASRRVCALGHQVHGAIGFTEEHELSAYLRQAIAGELSFGDADVHYQRVADLIGAPPAGPDGAES